MRVVYCSPQLDGIAAAAIILRSARLHGADARLGGTLTFENCREQFEAMSQHNGDIIFILDFLPDNIKEFEPILSRIIANNRIAYWNSHHPRDTDAEEILKKHAHTIDLSGPLHHGPLPKQKTCAAELAHKRFLPNDSVAQELARLAHDNEFWERTDKQAQQLADIIASGIEPKELIDNLARGVLWSENFERIRNAYLEKKTTALRDILKHLTIKNILQYKFGFTLAPTLLPTADAGQHLLDNHAGIDVTAVLYRNGRISFRKRDTCQLHLGELARIFGGGGHAYAGGAKLASFPSITREQFEKAVFAVDQKLKEHLL